MLFRFHFGLDEVEWVPGDFFLFQFDYFSKRMEVISAVTKEKLDLG